MSKLISPSSRYRRSLGVILTSATIIALAACASDQDEPLSLADNAAAAPAVVGSDIDAVKLLENAFPTHADRVLGRVQNRGFVTVDRGFARGPSTSSAMHLDVQLPLDAHSDARFTAPGGFEIRVRQIDVDGDAVVAGNAVRYRRAGGSSFWTVTDSGAEEWIHLHAGRVTSDVDVAAAWEIDGATPVAMDNAVALMDANGVAKAWVTAPEGYGASGRQVDLRMTTQGNRIELHADARGEEVLIDPMWVVVAPVATGRWGSTLTTLANGKALFANGFTGAALPNTTQVYDPVANTWSAGGNITTARYFPGAVLLNTGRVFVMGGQTLAGYSTTTELYDPVANTWSAGPAMSVARGLPLVALLANGKVLAAGGYDGTNFSVTAQVYDPVANTWSAAGNLAIPRALGVTVRLANGKVLVAAGINTSINTPTVLASAEVYDPATNTWSAAGSLATGRYFTTGALLSTGKVILAGGYNAAGVELANAELYDPATNTWSVTAPAPTVAAAAAAVLLGNGTFLVAGGDAGAAATTAAATYNPITATWTSAGTMTTARQLAPSAMLVGGDALVASGQGGGVALASVERYVYALAAGAACAQGTDCQSGFCVDAVCCQVAMCTPSDQCHNAGTCQAGTGTCSNPNKADGSACSDGNACTQTDTCTAGACGGANPVMCAAMDQCHDVGTCNSMTGMCSNPNKADGTVCNDGNACTQTDTCTMGACGGANPVMCAAMDQCHDVGTCDSATGMCSNPNKADGTVCNDGNACTQTDTCTMGACGGANPVMCAAMDQCHDVGTCDSATGACSNPPKADGAVCDDGDGCTQTDTCTAGACGGANPVVCAAMDQCHDAGTCDSATGACSNPAKADGVACDDTDACTQTDTCTAGACTGANPVVCTAMDQCHDVGTCDSATGMCANPAKADGASCDDGDACTQTDTCTAGACAGASPVTCMAQDECHEAGKCAAATGMCDNPEKADGTACTRGTCKAGTCITDGAGGAGGGGGVNPTTDGGCGCRVAGSEGESKAPPTGLAGLALAALTMLRRRRSARG